MPAMPPTQGVNARASVCGIASGIGLVAEPVDGCGLGAHAPDGQQATRVVVGQEAGGRGGIKRSSSCGTAKTPQSSGWGSPPQGKAPAPIRSEPHDERDQALLDAGGQVHRDVDLELVLHHDAASEGGVDVVGVEAGEAVVVGIGVEAAAQGQDPVVAHRPRVLGADVDLGGVLQGLASALAGELVEVLVARARGPPPSS